jgi:branched-chain amino acid transport system ATP-binding protein
MLLKIDEIIVHYGRSQALRGVSLEVEKGSIVALIGSNGAGKTTTLKAVSGLIVPSSGEICFEGKKINGMRVEDVVASGIAHVPEGRRLFPTMTVMENLDLGGYLRKAKDELAADLEEVYSRFPVLKEKRKSAAGSLSGGQQQMLATARALMLRPKLLLMDEPTLGLSPILVREVGDMVVGINTRGVSVVLVEQNARMALRISRKAYVLEVGKTVLHGDSISLLHDAYVKKAYLGM